MATGDLQVASLLDELRQAVIEGDASLARSWAEKALAADIDPKVAIEEGITKGIREVGEQFGAGQCFLPELVAAAEATKASLEVLTPAILARGGVYTYRGKVLIGTVAGDIHDLGKNIVASLLTADGFEIVDLGVNVPNEAFVAQVLEQQPDIVGMSALMTTTMLRQMEVIELLEEAGVREQVKVIIGGAVIGAEWAEDIGADGFATDAYEATKLCRRLLSVA